MFEDRRAFLKKLPLGVALLTAGTDAYTKDLKIEKIIPARSKVSFVAGKDRRQMMVDVLKPFETEIANGIKNKQVLIKPNCVWDSNPLCATHPDAIRGVLDFLKPMYDRPVIIGESTASPKGTLLCFEQYKYMPIANEYNVKMVDLNSAGYKNIWILGTEKHPLDIKIIDTFLNPDIYLISLARMKTHNCVVTTLSFKNVLMASPLNRMKGQPDFVSNQFEKAKMHSGESSGFNYNMFTLAHHVKPELAIIDGVEGMEGNGPNNGTPVEHGIALAGLDTIAVDRIGSECMGVDYSDIGYLQWCAADGIGQGDRNMIDILGPGSFEICNQIQDERQY